MNQSINESVNQSANQAADQLPNGQPLAHSPTGFNELLAQWFIRSVFIFLSMNKQTTGQSWLVKEFVS